MNLTFRLLLCFALATAPVARCQREEKLIFHVITVVSRPDGGFLVEAKNKNIYYYLSCTSKNMCMRLHAGRDYEGYVRIFPTGEPSFVPKDAPKFPSKMADGSTTTDLMVPFMIVGESEVPLGINGARASN